MEHIWHAATTVVTLLVTTIRGLSVFVRGLGDVSTALLATGTLITISLYLLRTLGYPVPDFWHSVG